MNKLDELHRAVQAEPDNTDARAALLNERSRVEGSKVFLEPLMDREGWNRTPEPIQDMAAQEVGRRLGSGYELKEIKVWSCKNVRACEECGGQGVVREDTRWDSMGHPAEALLDRSDLCRSCYTTKEGEAWTSQTISHRLATFEHRTTGIELQLLPGRLGEFEEMRCRYNPEAGTIEIDNTSHEVASIYIIAGNELVTITSVPPLSSALSNLSEYSVGNLKIKAMKQLSKGVKPFLVGRWPVTVSHIGNEIAGPEGFLRPSDSGYIDLPESSWGFDSMASWLKETRLRMPSADEWEYACRAGTETRFYWGDELDSTHIWFEGTQETCNSCGGDGWAVVGFGSCDDCQGLGVTIPGVMEHERARKWNAFGLVDMIGSVWEYTSKAGRYTGTFGGSLGTSRDIIEAISLLSFRGYDDQVYHGQETGFRAACSIPGL